ncbi:hypothetical protein HDU96_001263 [Phlyctochytrium bullatum]|nr:hypothetical protein HDU96_001263 [Phlyctochytrium bullatum]
MNPDRTKEILNRFLPRGWSDWIAPSCVALAFTSFFIFSFLFITITLTQLHAIRNPDDGEVFYTSAGLLMWWLHLFFSLYILFNVVFNYYMAVVTDPGLPELVESLQTHTLPPCEPAEKSGVEVNGDAPPPLFCDKCISQRERITAGSVSAAFLGWTTTIYFSNNFIRLLYYVSCLASVTATNGIGFVMINSLLHVLSGQTTIERKRLETLRAELEPRGERVINEYDLGMLANLRFFLNVSDRYPWWYALLPIPVPPATDGTWYPKVSRPPPVSKETSQDTLLGDPSDAV